MAKMEKKRKKIYFMFGSGGGGHKASAKAVLSVVSEQHPEWEVSLLNASAIAGMLFGDMIYNKILEFNLTKLIPVLYMITSTFQPIAEPGLLERFKKYWETVPKPDAVVSFVPFLNTILCRSLPESVHMTVLTDFANSRAHPWLQVHEQNVVVGTDEAQEQAISLGFPREKITRVSGMVVHPDFYNRYSDEEIDEFRIMYGLDPSKPTFLILFGSHPPTSFAMELVRLLSSRVEDAVNCICICGRNSELREKLLLKQKEEKLPRTVVFGFTTKIPLLMQMSDIVLGKPGPGVVSEALVSGRPVILFGEQNGVMEQELDVLRWVLASGVGLVASTLEEVSQVSSHRVSQLKESVERLAPNNAVFEAVQLLEQLLT